MFVSKVYDDPRVEMAVAVVIHFSVLAGMKAVEAFCEAIVLPLARSIMIYPTCAQGRDSSVTLLP